MSRQISNYINLLPDEIISIIYRDVFNNCLDELKEKISYLAMEIWREL